MKGPGDDSLSGVQMGAPLESILTGQLAEALREAGYPVTIAHGGHEDAELIILGELVEFRTFGYAFKWRLSIMSTVMFKSRDGRVLWAKNYNFVTYARFFEGKNSVIKRGVDEYLEEIVKDVRERFGPGDR
jgi:hypothetical protein